jgi:hypothetical protein
VAWGDDVPVPVIGGAPEPERPAPVETYQIEVHTAHDSINWNVASYQEGLERLDRIRRDLESQEYEFIGVDVGLNRAVLVRRAAVEWAQVVTYRWPSGWISPR